MNIYVAIISLALFLALLPEICLASTSIKDQRLICTPGEAVASITWVDETEKIKKFHYECTNANPECEELCEWTDSCSIHRYGENCYLRGFRAMFDNPQDVQRYIFLCCNSTLSTNHTETHDARKCDGSMKKLQQKSYNRRYKTFFRQATSNFPEVSPVLLYAEICVKKSMVPTPVCPAAKMRTHIGTDPALYGMARLAGLAGLAGLALIRRKSTGSLPAPSPRITTTTTTMTMTTTRPCCRAADYCLGCCCNEGTLQEACDVDCKICIDALFSANACVYRGC